MSTSRIDQRSVDGIRFRFLIALGLLMVIVLCALLAAPPSPTMAHEPTQAHAGHGARLESAHEHAGHGHGEHDTTGHAATETATPPPRMRLSLPGVLRGR